MASTAALAASTDSSVSTMTQPARWPLPFGQGRTSLCRIVARRRAQRRIRRIPARRCARNRLFPAAPAPHLPPRRPDSRPPARRRQVPVDQRLLMPEQDGLAAQLMARSRDGLHRRRRRLGQQRNGLFGHIRALCNRQCALGYLHAEGHTGAARRIPYSCFFGDSLKISRSLDSHSYNLPLSYTRCVDHFADGGDGCRMPQDDSVRPTGQTGRRRWRPPCRCRGFPRRPTRASPLRA